MSNWMHPSKRNSQAHLNRTHECEKCGYVQGEKKLVAGKCRVCGGEVKRVGTPAWRNNQQAA